VAQGTTPPHVRRLAIAAGGTLFGLLAAHTLLEVGRDSLFLTRLPVEQLPFAYLTIAVVAAIGAGLDRRLPESLARHLPRMTLLGGALMAGTFFFVFDTAWVWAPHAFYVGTGMIATLAVAQFWRLLTELFTVSEAKRLYTRVAAVGSLGAMAGAASAELALRWIDPRGLLLLGAAVYVLTAVVPHAWLSNAVPYRAPLLRTSLAPERMSVRSGVYLRQLLVLLAFAATTATLVDYVFKATIDSVVTDADIPRFLSSFHLGLNFLSVVVQLAIAPRIFRARGVTRGLVILPLLVLFGSAFTLTFGGLAAVVFLRGADGALRNSLYRSAIELLYFPLARNVRRRFKALVDAVGHRAGQTIGSLAILGATFVGLGPRELAIAVGVLALGSIALSLTMRGGYVALFREHLRAGTLEPPATVPELDLHSLEHLIASLSSDDEEEVLASLKLLSDYNRVHLVPALLLLHPSPRVAIRALEMFEARGRRDFGAIGRRLLDHEDPGVQDAAARALASVLAPHELRAELDHHREASVNAAVLVSIVARGLDTDGSAARELERMSAEGSGHVRLAIVRAVRSQRAQALAYLLHRFIEPAANDPELRRELAQAFEALRDEAAVPALIRWLGPRQARAEARAALVAIGAFDALEQALLDESLPRSLRAHLPRTIAHFKVERAAHALFDRLEHEADGWIRYKILRALRSLREALPELRVPEQRLIRQLTDALERASLTLASRLALREMQTLDPSRQTAGGELLEPVLREKEGEAIDRAVRLVCLLDGAGATSIRRALQSSDARRRAESRELLVHIARSTSISNALAALLEEAGDEERLDHALRALGLSAPPRSDYAELVRELTTDPSEAVRAIAIHHAAELGLWPKERARDRNLSPIQTRASEAADAT
jgi:AAA family ATP:ADP antiporter